ncbi:MAG: hypothetical protein KAI79_12950, partial [Bacteroidales bacterium]|nr:hypothetical protein [Bacteroidales bacterium]
IISFVAFLLLGGLYLVAEELIILLFSEKWLPSVDFFKVLVWSGFAYPISTLLVNVLISRGNSKAVLRLYIYKTFIFSLNLVALYIWGIDTYLYGLIVVAFFWVSLNILYASREIKLPFYLFAKPILVQMGITVIAVLLTMFIVQNIKLLDIIMLIIKGSLFTFLYIFLNYSVKTTSFNYVLEQIMPIVKKKWGKKVKS